MPIKPEKFFLLMALLESVMIAGVFFLSQQLYGDPFDFEKSVVLWAVALAPFPIAMLIYIQQMKKK